MLCILIVSQQLGRKSIGIEIDANNVGIISQHNIIMSDLNTFYRDLLVWEKQQFIKLVYQWPHDLRDAIEVAFVDAVAETGIKGSVCPLEPDSTNQSIGNQVEKYTVAKLNDVIEGFSISSCSGQGYPDQILVQSNSNLRMPLEMKATSEWNPKDANRRVLTSSSAKLRDQFASPIYHLLVTVLYTPNHNKVRINRIRLDFLEPTTTVNVRLEASVNHKILADGHHHSKMI